MAQPFRLKLRRLDFISAVDAGAQGPISNVALIKRADPNGFEATFKVAKLDTSLGLVFGWAMAGTLDGGKTPHVDLQDDAIDVDGDHFLKVCAEFMEGGAAADVMHDGAQDGRVVFAMPLIPEINKALGIETKTHGLAIAMKPSPETFKRFQSGELAAFSIGGIGDRSNLDAAHKSRTHKSRTRKSDDKRYLTDEVMGHQHEAHSYDGQEPWMSDATSEGAAMPHRHIVVREPDGSLTVLADSGHTHTLTEQPKVIVVPDDTATVSEEVAARAPKESPPTVKSRTVINKETIMDPTKELADLKALQEKLNAKIAELEAQLADATVQASLTDAEKEHIASLSTAEAKRFRSLEKSARFAEVTKARESDPVVATIDGTEYRKSTPGSQLAVKLAEQIEKAESGEIEKQATAHLGFLAGDKADHAELIKAVHAFTKGNLEKRAKLLTVLDGANGIAKSRTKVAGFDGASGDSGASSGDAYEALTKGLAKFCAEQKIDKVWTVGLQKFKSTPEGAALNEAHLATLSA